MHDAKQLLQAEAHHAPQPDFSIDDVSRRRDRVHRRRRVIAGAVGGLVTVPLVAFAVAGIGPFGTTRSVHVARGGIGLPPADRPAPTVGPNEYTYVHLSYESRCTIGEDRPDTTCPDVELNLESWWTSDASGRIRTSSKHNYGGFSSGTFGTGTFPTEGDLEHFPLDPDELRAFLLERSESDGSSPRPDVTPSPGVPVDDGQLWNAIQDYLADTQYLNATPALRVAMLEVLATIPMVQVDATAQDPTGRDAIALRFVAYATDVVVYVDPSTHDFLAMTQRQDGYEGTVLALAAGVAKSTDEVPIGDDRSIPTEP